MRNETNVRFTEDSFYAQQWVLPLTVEKKDKKAITLLFPFSSFSFSLSVSHCRRDYSDELSSPAERGWDLFLVWDLAITKVHKIYFPPKTNI